jgi:hypothetical protein
VFQNEELSEYLESSYTISSQSAIIAEWNMNVPGNIQKVGNYRYRKNSTQFSALPNFFDRSDLNGFYTGATDADITVSYGLEDDATTPLLFTYPKDKEKLYYSLEDCIKPFRPRSGINKLSYFSQKYLSHPNQDMYLRPRYYMPHRDDEFKYWRSYRTESSGNSLATSNIEYGISKNAVGTIYPIDDAVPFVVYKEPVPANKIVVKVQTNVGGINLGPFKNADAVALEDPFFGDSNKTVPQNFRIQYLSENDEWLDAYVFNQASTRSDGVSPIFDYDGYLSVEYGLSIPEQYRDTFLFIGYISNIDTLPQQNIFGHAYLLTSDLNTLGTLYVYNGLGYDTFVPEYNWIIGEDEANSQTRFVTKLTNPESFTVPNTSAKAYREFVWVKGIRLVVESMNTPNAPLELIEISPRLNVNLTDKLISFDISKTLSDLTSSALPVGQLMASTGSLVLFDEDSSFNFNNAWDFSENSGSIVSKYVSKNVKFVFYEVIQNVNGDSYYVPLKTLYSEGIPQADQANATISMNLRDFFFYLESVPAPSILLTEVSLSQAVCILLDSIGFSNYVFKRLENESDPVIPFFFVAPEQNVAEVLTQLAVATQSAMFFDEFNNFVVMSKNYLLDNTEERSVDMEIFGQTMLVDTIGNKYVYAGNVYTIDTLPATKEPGAYLNFANNGIYVWSDSANDWILAGTKKATNWTIPANIENIASEDQKVYNAGSIDYTARYIQRSYGSLQQALQVDKTWIYKPVLLWEVSGTEATTSSNTERQEKYVLGAMPLNTDLDDNPPRVVNHIIVNNIIDVGENSYFITRFKGYFYANGEIIRYDAVEFSVTGFGNVWISDNLEYQKYFAQLPFNGKIYPTGQIRVYAEPYYETINDITKLKNGAVLSHGRGQFGTPIAYHSAGLDSYWTSNTNVRGIDMRSQFLYTTEIEPQLPSTELGLAGVNNSRAEKANRNGVIRNFLSSSYSTETDVANLKSTTTGTIQSSAFIITGPDIPPSETARDFVTYVHKPLDKSYKHFGTRVRIIGKVESLGDRSQSPVGGMTYFNVTGSDPTQTISIGGGSAGIALVNPDSNNGYYFEIAALTSSKIESYLNTNSATGEATNTIDNILFYQVKKEVGSSRAIPQKLWGGIGNIIVDDGSFTGQYRFTAEENPTVYDLAIEYVDINDSTRVFYLYINQKLVKVFTQTSDIIPLINPSIGLFVRGTSKAMFENVYALGKNYASNAVFDVNVPIASVFGDDNNQVNATEALNKYALSGIVQKTYLSGVRPNSVPDYAMYYEEFGTIMREAAYFNIKYDRAYPALYAVIAPTFTRLKGYTVSGFSADSYGAEFLIFNNTDTLLNLDETTGNYLRILGIAFTQDTTNTITVDDYLKRRGNLADPEIRGESIIYSPFRFIEQYEQLRVSRLLYGKNEFSLNSPYIQDQDTAEDLIGWLIEKNLRPRKAVGISIFPNPTIQLGDIININYKNNEGIDVISSSDTRFVVYNITYNKSVSGPSMTIYLSEV